MDIILLSMLSHFRRCGIPCGDFRQGSYKEALLIVREAMSQSKITESKDAIKSEDLVKAGNGEMDAAALNDQHLAANAPMQQAVDTEQQAQACACCSVSTACCIGALAARC